jgi:DNA-binding IclR family transcriptional regulator
MLTMALPAFAGLGQDVSSVQADQLHMQGSLRITQSQAYTVHEIRSATGTVVREYVSASGKVFAVAWQGPWLPDMRQVLATYFDQYQQAARTQFNSNAGRRPLLIQQPGLVVQSGGHMRSFAGRAYIPEMLPQAVSVEEIR